MYIGTYSSIQIFVDILCIYLIFDTQVSESFMNHQNSFVSFRKCRITRVSKILGQRNVIAKHDKFLDPFIAEGNIFESLVIFGHVIFQPFAFVLTKADLRLGGI